MVQAASTVQSPNPATIAGAAVAPAWGVRWLEPSAIDAAFVGDWTALAERAAEPNPFAEPWFLLPSLRHLGGDGARFLAVEQGGLLAGLILLAREDHYGRIPVRHIKDWRHHHLFLGTPLIRKGAEEAVWRAIICALDAEPWCEGFLHLNGLAEDGVVHKALVAAATALGRPCPTVHRETRAFLESDLAPTAYYEAAVRSKKRKELRRQRNRLGEIGEVICRRLAPEDDLQAWCSDFLRLEKLGWKGEAGSALACEPATEAFFREALEGARAAGKLEILRMEIDGLPIAMLVNFRTPPGSFSFKTAFDEQFARFSPGVLIQIENLELLDDPATRWMDSCAATGHPMIDSLWMERRHIVRVSLPLSGMRRRLAYAAARGLEEASAFRRRMTAKPAPNPAGAPVEDKSE